VKVPSKRFAVVVSKWAEGYYIKWLKRVSTVGGIDSQQDAIFVTEVDEIHRYMRPVAVDYK
jgi:hypothetical protein